jgi:hypothetical protein
MNHLLPMVSESARPWTDEEAETAARMYAHRWNGYGARKSAIVAIAKALNRSDESVASRLRHCGETFRRPREVLRVHKDNPRPHRRQNKTQNHPVATPRKGEIPDDVLVDRDYRALLDHETLTAAFCGDPLPGYSARDRR